MKTTNSNRPGTRTPYSPAKGTAFDVRMLRPISGGPARKCAVLVPEAADVYAATVRCRTGQFGEVTYFAKIGSTVYDWSPIQGGWVAPL